MVELHILTIGIIIIGAICSLRVAYLIGFKKETVPKPVSKVKPTSYFIHAKALEPGDLIEAFGQIQEIIFVAWVPTIEDPQILEPQYKITEEVLMVPHQHIKPLSDEFAIRVLSHDLKVNLIRKYEDSI